MTLRQTEYDYIETCVNLLQKKFNEVNMIELGNQRLAIRDFFIGPAKQYFSKRGVNHISIDMNGLDGSIPIDLSIPINQFIGWADIATNAGTLEHIPLKQEVAFENFHKVTKVGGYMVHSLPLQNNWKGHCPHHYTENFVKKLASVNHYEIIKHELISRDKNKRRVLIHTILKKNTDAPFVVSGEWLKEISYTEKYDHNTDNLR